MLRAGWLIVATIGLGAPAFAQEELNSPYPVYVAPQTDAAKPESHPVSQPRKTVRPAPHKSASIPVPRSDTRKGTSQPTEPAPLTTASIPKRENKAEETKRDTGVFADIPFDERIRIQAALFWSGDYAGTSGSDDPMLAAVKNFQKRIKAKVTGILSPAERERLLAAARDSEQEYGWSIVVDPATGIRIGLPTKMVRFARDTAGGTRWSSKHGEVQVETFRIKEPGLKLAAVFEAQKKSPAARRIDRSVLNDDSFYISGMQGLKYFSVRAKIRDGEVRGFTILYDQMMETIVAPVTVAMATAFSPFPDRPAPFAAPVKRVEYGNGIVVSARGHIVTDRKLVDGCQVIVAAGLGDVERIAEDKTNELALLRVYNPGKLSPLPLAQGLTKTTDITLVGIPHPKEENGDGKLAEIKAKVVDGMLIELRRPVPMAGFSGAPAINAQGRFVGITEIRNTVLAGTGPVAAPIKLIGADTIRTFLSEHKIDVAASGSDAKASVVRLICVRQ